MVASEDPKRFIPKFMYYTGPAFKASEKTEGDISTLGPPMKASILQFQCGKARIKCRTTSERGEVHVAAMKQFKAVSNYENIHGYFNDEILSHPNAIEVWKTCWRRVHGYTHPVCGDKSVVNLIIF